jgi:hypothetical protein
MAGHTLKEIAGEVGDQRIIVAFDRPQRLQKVNLEMEEPEMSRTQELLLGGARGEPHSSSSHD